MPDTIKIPGIGPMNKKYVYVGAAGIAGFVAFAYYRSRQAVDTTVDDTTDTTDDTLADDTTYDPAYDGGYVGDVGDSGYYYGSASSYYPPYGSSNPISTGAPATDSAWTQASVEYLAGVGVDSTAASHALGLYMSDQCMTAAEADLVRQAIAGMNAPPQTHHDIKICQVSSPPADTATKPTAPAGFHVTSTGTTQVGLAWTVMPNVLGYHIKIKGPGFDHTVVTHNTGTYTVGNLHRKSTYQFYVMAYNGAGTGDPSPTVTAKTK